MKNQHDNERAYLCISDFVSPCPLPSLENQDAPNGGGGDHVVCHDDKGVEVADAFSKVSIAPSINSLEKFRHEIKDSAGLMGCTANPGTPADNITTSVAPGVKLRNQETDFHQNTNTKLPVGVQRISKESKDITKLEDDSTVDGTGGIGIVRNREWNPDNDESPLSESSSTDHVGMFVVTCSGADDLCRKYEEEDLDDYQSIMVKALADRLVEVRDSFPVCCSVRFLLNLLSTKKVQLEVGSNENSEVN